MRALLTDLDRTLTGPDLRPDPRAMRRMAELRAHGIRVVLVSGRTLAHMLAAGLGEVTDAIVAENGSLVHVPGRAPVEVGEAGFGPRARAALGPLAPQFHWGRVLGSGPRELAAEAAQRLLAHGVRHELSFNAEEVMLLPPRVDKAAGAARLLRELGIRPEEAAAIGDGENDVPLLRFAGTSGAPGNAHPAARAAATMRDLPAYADGFLAFTDEVFLAAPGGRAPGMV